MHKTITSTPDSIVDIDGRSDVKQLLNPSSTILPKGYVSARWGNVELLFFDMTDWSNQAIRRAFVIVSPNADKKFSNSIILFQLIALEISAQAFDSILNDFPYLRHNIMSCTVDPTTYIKYVVAQHKVLTKLLRSSVSLGDTFTLRQALIFASETFLEYVLHNSYCSTDWEVQPELRAYGKALVHTLVKHQDSVPTHREPISIEYMAKLMDLPEELSSLLPIDLALFIKVEGVYRREDHIHCSFSYELSLLMLSGETMTFEASKLYNDGQVELFDGENWRKIILSGIAMVNARSFVFSLQDYKPRDMVIACRYLFTFGNLPIIYNTRGQRHLELLLAAEADFSFIKFHIDHGMRLCASSIRFLPASKDYLRLLKWYATRKSRSYVDFPELVEVLLEKKMYKSVRSVLSVGDLHIRSFREILCNQLTDLRLSIFTQSEDQSVARSDSENVYAKSELMVHSVFNVGDAIYPPYLNTLVLHQPYFVHKYLDELHKQQPEIFAQDMQAALDWILMHEELLLPLLICVLNQAKDKDLVMHITEDQKSHLIDTYPFSNVLKQLLGRDTVCFAPVVSSTVRPLVESPSALIQRCSKIINKLEQLQKALYLLVGATGDDFKDMVAILDSLTPRDRSYFLKLADALSLEYAKFTNIADAPSDDHYNTICFGEIRVEKFQVQLAYCRQLQANACVSADTKSAAHATENKAARVRRPVIRSVMQQVLTSDSKPTNASRYKPIWTTVIRAFADEYDLLSDEHKHLGLVRFMNAVQRLNYLFEFEPDATYMRNSYVQTNLARNFVSHRLLCLSEDQRQSALAQYEGLLDYARLNTEDDYDPKSRVSALISMLNHLESAFPKSPDKVKSLYKNLLLYTLAKYKLEVNNTVEQVAILVDIGVCVTELYTSTDAYPIEDGLGSCLQGLRNIVVHDVLSDTDLDALKSLQATNIDTNLTLMNSNITRLVHVIVNKWSFLQLIEDNCLCDTQTEAVSLQVSNDDQAKSDPVLAMK